MLKIDKISLNNNYQKQTDCSGICGFCRNWKIGICEGMFQRFIKDNEGNILCGYDVRYLENPLEIYIEVCKKMKELNYMTKDELTEKLNIYGLEVTGRDLKYHVSLGLLEPPIREGIPGITGSVSYWKDNTPKILYTILNIKKLGIKLTFEDIKYYIKLLKFDALAFREIKKIKEEDLHLKMFLTLRGITPEQREQLQKKYHSYFCEILLSRYDIFEDALKYWLYIELMEPYILMDHESLEFLEIEQIVIDPNIDTNIDEIENLNEAYFKLRYGDPINQTITFKNL
jgi:hypothetical protein